MINNGLLILKDDLNSLSNTNKLVHNRLRAIISQSLSFRPNDSDVENSLYIIRNILDGNKFFKEKCHSLQPPFICGGRLMRENRKYKSNKNNTNLI